MWNAIEGLGASDTPEVRRWLTKKLGSTDDAGHFLAAAKTLARLREKKALPVIVKRLHECRAGLERRQPAARDRGVWTPRRQSGGRARGQVDPRSAGKNVQNAFARLQREAKDQARRVARALIAQKKRFAGFPEALRKRVEKAAR